MLATKIKANDISQATVLHVTDILRQHRLYLDEKYIDIPNGKRKIEKKRVVEWGR